MTTIGVVTACHTYEHFLPGWMHSVAVLDRQPDSIVIAATNPAKVVLTLSEETYPVDYRVVTGPNPFRWGESLNAAIAACDTDWIVWIGADDRYLPHALSGWENSHHDIVCFGLETTRHGYKRIVNPPPTRQDVCNPENRNLVPCGSPFKREVWESTHFDSEGFTPYEDWAFAHMAAWKGASIGTTGRIDYSYTIHGEQVSNTAPKEDLFARRLTEWNRAHA